MRPAWRLLLRPLLSHSETMPTHLPSSHAVPPFPLLYSTDRPSPPPPSEDHAQLLAVFSSKIGVEEIQAHLDSSHVKFDNGFLNSALRNLETKPDFAGRIFNWVYSKKPEILSSNTYNIMLSILAMEGKSVEFWEMLEIMKKKGYCLSRTAFLKSSDSLEQLGLLQDLGKLKEIYSSNSPENCSSRISSKVCKILREGDEMGEELWKDLKELEIGYSSDLVVSVLEKLAGYPAKSSLFFRWAIDYASFKAEGKSYNALARVLGREDCLEGFLDLLKEMKDLGFGLEPGTYSKVSRRFISRGMSKEAVDLFEFAVDVGEKPSPKDFLHLLKKIAMSRGDLELSLVSRIVRISKNAGYPLKGSIFGSVIKSLTSVDRQGESGSLLKAMEEGGFSAGPDAPDRVAVELCRARKPDLALDFVLEKEASGHIFEIKTWVSLIQSYSLAGSTDNCLSCFYRMIEKRGGKKVGIAFEAVVAAYLRKNKALDIYQVLSDLVEKDELEPLQTTYKVMIKRLLSEGRLREASTLLTLMKCHGYPPFIEPFFGFISKFGSGEDAMVFLKSMTAKAFPSISVFIRTLEGVLKAGRKETADDLLSKSPSYVKNHADVLNLIFSHKLQEGTPNPELVPA